MIKKFNKFEQAAIKRTAQNVNPMVSKKRKIEEQITELQAEWDRLDCTQQAYESSIKAMTGGYTTEDLVEKVIEPTNSVDKNGNTVKITKYVFKYPETIIPCKCTCEECDLENTQESEEVVEEDYEEVNEELHDEEYRTGNTE